MGYGLYNPIHVPWVMGCTTVSFPHAPWVVQRHPFPMGHGLYNGIWYPWVMGCTTVSITHAPWVVQHYPCPMGYGLYNTIYSPWCMGCTRVFILHAPCVVQHVLSQTQLLLCQIKRVIHDVRDINKYIGNNKKQQSNNLSTPGDPPHKHRPSPHNNEQSGEGCKYSVSNKYKPRSQDEHDKLCNPGYH